MTAVVVILVVLVVLLVLGYLVTRSRGRARLQERFGPEYERTITSADSRREAERALKEREQRVDALDIRPLPPASRERYLSAWKGTQARFVDTPAEAVNEADRLVSSVMAERGYPTEGFEQQASDLSVEHSSVLDHYRSAHEVSVLNSQQQATTEQLRTAMVHYRALFEELVETGGASTS